jgi:hypothetical protein
MCGYVSVCSFVSLFVCVFVCVCIRVWLSVEDPAERDATYFRELAKDAKNQGTKIMELLVTRSPRERASMSTSLSPPGGLGVHTHIYR